jgi:hypothetical protein
MKQFLSLLILLSLFSCKTETSPYLHAGKMVAEVGLSIDSVERPGALDSIVRYGTDTRYYTLVRGWLVQELAGVNSQLQVEQSEKKIALQKRKSFLERAIRRIDLE